MRMRRVEREGETGSYTDIKYFITWLDIKPSDGRPLAWMEKTFKKDIVYT